MVLERFFVWMHSAGCHDCVAVLNDGAGRAQPTRHCTGAVRILRGEPYEGDIRGERLTMGSNWKRKFEL